MARAEATKVGRGQFGSSGKRRTGLSKGLSQGTDLRIGEGGREVMGTGDFDSQQGRQPLDEGPLPAALGGRIQKPGAHRPAPCHSREAPPAYLLLSRPAEVGK